jgi:LacI family transcriptional regulator
MLSQNPQKRVLLAMGSRYIDRIHHGVAEYAGKHSWHLSNLFGDDPGLVHNRDCDGIITVLAPGDAFSERILACRKPLVDLSIFRQDLNIPHLTGDNAAMGREAAWHFLERGFKHFTWFSDKNNDVAQDRLKGFQDELRARGFGCGKLIVSEAFRKPTPAWAHLQQWIQQNIRKMPKPCAIYAYNDVLAVDLVDACLAGDIRIPDEVAVLGTDNHPLICSTAAVPLSSINHDLEELGRRGAEELDKVLMGAPLERKIIKVPHRGITIRQSTDVFAINDPHVVKALHFLHQNFLRNIGVMDVVEATLSSRRSLEQRFHDSLGESILNRLSHIRLQHVCRLLKDTSLSIADIASQSGFTTPEYLHRVFRKKFGKTPRQYRIEQSA